MNSFAQRHDITSPLRSSIYIKVWGSNSNAAGFPCLLFHHFKTAKEASGWPHSFHPPTPKLASIPHTGSGVVFNTLFLLPQHQRSSTLGMRPRVPPLPQFTQVPFPQMPCAHRCPALLRWFPQTSPVTRSQALLGSESLAVIGPS